VCAESLVPTVVSTVSRKPAAHQNAVATFADRRGHEGAVLVCLRPPNRHLLVRGVPQVSVGSLVVLLGSLVGRSSRLVPLLAAPADGEASGTSPLRRRVSTRTLVLKRDWRNSGFSSRVNQLKSRAPLAFVPGGARAPPPWPRLRVGRVVMGRLVRLGHVRACHAQVGRLVWAALPK
jgi:hypothetical protein